MIIDDEINDVAKRLDSLVIESEFDWKHSLFRRIRDAFKALVDRNSELQAKYNALHNEHCDDGDYVFCACKKSHSEHEIASCCQSCGGVVEGIVMTIKSRQEGQSIKNATARSLLDATNIIKPTNNEA